MFPEACYEDCAVELEPGEMMLVYSDGLTEATDEAGEEFGVERLEALLPELHRLAPEEVGRRLLAEVDRFLGDARPTDDLSIAVVVREGAA